MNHADTPPELSQAYEDLFAEFVATYEDRRREELFEEARMMTSIGMAGADRRDRRTADFLEAALNQTNGDEEAFLAYIKKWWK